MRAKSEWGRGEERKFDAVISAHELTNVKIRLFILFVTADVAKHFLILLASVCLLCYLAVMWIELFVL